MYQSKLNLIETERAIKFVKDNFERDLAKALNLTRVSAPLFVLPESGLNDNLNGYERAVAFDIPEIGKTAEIVQSLAKWKRMALKKYCFECETGLYTDMNAIRRDENLDAIHSVYVDQWDWEKIITDELRTTAYLYKTVRAIYSVLKKLAKKVSVAFPEIATQLPERITFITSQKLLEMYPDMTAKERENAIAKDKGAVFVSRIGGKLKNGQPHDGRAADYDDWSLNGDILLWFDELNMAFEISSMGIRVNAKSLEKQLKTKCETAKLGNPYCQAVISGELPLTIGGGIGQSRLCMFFLKKAHIGEVQASVWNDEMLSELDKRNIHLL